MIRALLRLIILLVVLAAIGFYLTGYRPNMPWQAERPIGTSGKGSPIDSERVRDAGAKVGAAVARGANEAERVVSETALTAKIKAKMALDDSVKARDIGVTTTGTVVTLTGTVHSQAEHTRAVQLAKETSGVTSVIDHLTVR